MLALIPRLRRRLSACLCAYVCVLGLWIPVPAGAHDSPATRIRALDAALLVEPGNGALRFERAGLLLEVGRPDAALADLEASDRPHEDAEALWLRARIHAARQDPARAEPVLTTLIASRPRPAAAWLEARARAREALRRPDGAVADWEAAVQLESMPERVLRWGRALESLGRRDEAVRAWLGGMGDPEAPVVLRAALVDALLALGRGAEALPWIDALLPRLSARAAWLIRRGDGLKAMGRHQDARGAWRQAEAELEARYARRPTRLLEQQLRRVRGRLAGR